MSQNQPFRVVDLFAGCGGLSLGFEALQGPEDDYLFEVTMGFEIDPNACTIYNSNRRDGFGTPDRPGLCRQIDVADYLNEAEILAHYLWHLCKRTKDSELERQLTDLGIAKLHEDLAQADQVFSDELGVLVSPSGDWFETQASKLSKGVLGQTAVLAFFRRLKLPMLTRKENARDPRNWNGVWSLWTGADRVAVPLVTENHDPSIECERWAQECTALAERVASLKQAQLPEEVRNVERSERIGMSKAAGRIQEFLVAIQSPAGELVRECWVRWMAHRRHSRSSLFGQEDQPNLELLTRLRRTYKNGHQVQVLLGGPPCQGFSRAGRGKIKNLNLHGRHVQANATGIDERNLLFESYLRFVAALQPQVFLFENVAQFKSVVRIGNQSFDAATMLQEAIADLRTNEHAEHVNYAVDISQIKSEEWGVPQGRHRFFLAGFRTGRGHLPDATPVPDVLKRSVLKSTAANATKPTLAKALHNLPASQPFQYSTNLTKTFEIRREKSADELLNWYVSKPPAWSGHEMSHSDAHVHRKVRADDGLWFDIMAPNTRWQDYRVPAGATKLDELRNMANRLCEQLDTGQVNEAEFSSFVEQLEAPNLVGDLLLDAPRPGVADITKRVTQKSVPPCISEIKAIAKNASAKRLRQWIEKYLGDAPDAGAAIALRLLLTQLDPEHHLAREGTYLHKRSGAHGDWLVRLDPDAPCRTVVAHLERDTYGYIHPHEPRPISVREAARIQAFPDWFRFGKVGISSAFRAVGNAVPPYLSYQMAKSVAAVLSRGPTDPPPHRSPIAAAVR